MGLDPIIYLQACLQKKETKGKSAPSKAPAKKKEGGSGGKAKKKKWSKGKVRDQLNLVLFDKQTYDKFMKEVPSYKLITPSIVSERLKITATLAKKGLSMLFKKGLIKKIAVHHAQVIYTRNIAPADE